MRTSGLMRREFRHRQLRERGDPRDCKIFAYKQIPNESLAAEIIYRDLSLQPLGVRHNTCTAALRKQAFLNIFNEFPFWDLHCRYLSFNVINISITTQLFPYPLDCASPGQTRTKALLSCCCDVKCINSSISNTLFLSLLGN
jgi:hypothetical protein